MEPTFSELQMNLEKLEELYRQLLDLSKQKQRQLVESNLDEIERLTKEEEVLVYRASRIEKERYELTERLYAHYGLQGENNLPGLIEIAPPEVQKPLEEVKERLETLIAEMDKTNQENISLIKQSLRFINFTVDILSKAGDPAIYGSGNEKAQKAESVSRILDQKV